MPLSTRYGSLPFNEQIRFFRNKLNVPTEGWTDLWQHSHNSGFSVAGAMKDDLLNDFRQAVDAAIADGKSLTWFKKEFNNIVAKHGWQHTGKANWRAKVIFDTNMRQSYNAGRYEQLQQFDYWRYAHGDSRYPRELHLKWHGTLLPKSDAWWQTHFVSNGWGCKCRIYGVSQSELERKGLTTTAAPNDGMRDWTDKTSGEVHKVPNGIDPGFDYIPRREANLVKQRRLASQKASVYQAPERLVPTAFSTVKGVNVDGLNLVLTQLMQTAAAPQLQQLVNFVQSTKRKTVFIKSSEMMGGKRSTAISAEVGHYLGLNQLVAKRRFTSKRKPEGFTSSSYDHVVVKVAATHSLKRVNATNVLEGIRNIIKQGDSLSGPYTMGNKSLWWAFAEAGGNMHDDTSRFMTWIHEMSHQVHYKLGMPSPPTQKYLTHYGNPVNSEREWFAEHFSAYVLARTELQQVWPDVVHWFDEQLLEFGRL
ncbi:F protein [Shewanella sp. GutCb]|uniref:phage minor head protein n=1 Tax=Shewanella sp. GutCb TaxID=2058315 RepID=UPI000C7E614D|nr:phage minor head protein [Shewanella sp. GutCb]PKG73169.1 F protein [Shewanella sp. GutCb]